MKILEINNLYNGAGAENVMKLTGDNFIDKGHEVYYVTTQKIEKKNHIQIKSFQQKLFSNLVKKGGGSNNIFGNPMDSLGKKISLKLKKFIPLTNIFVNKQFEKIIKDIKPDLVHIHNLQPFGVGILKLFKKYNIPVYITLHGYWPICPSSLLYTAKSKKICTENNWDNCSKNCGTLDITKVMKKQKEIIENNVTKIITVSDYVKNRLIDFGYNKNKIITIHNGVDTKLFKPINNPTRNYILHVGRLSEIKGSKIVWEVAEKLNNTKFLFIGSKKPENIEIPKNIEFIGWIDTKELSKYYANALAVLTPSLWPEPHSLIPLEVMSSGTPIIATKVGGNSESIKNGQNGFLIELDNDIKTNIINTILGSNSDIIEKIGNEGRENALDNFSLDVMLNNYKNLFINKK